MSIGGPHAHVTLGMTSWEGVIPSEARSDFRTPVESIGLQKPENLLFVAALDNAVDGFRLRLQESSPIRVSPSRPC